jgi:hypothetical protein
VNGLQSVADVRQGPRGDRGESVDEIALGKGAIERRVDDKIGRRVGGLHPTGLAGASPSRHPRLPKIVIAPKAI